MGGNSYITTGWWLAIPVAVITFIGCWIYAFLEYGFLLGVGLGWFPSLLVGLIAGGLTIFLWGLIPVAVIVGVVLVMWSGRPAEVDAALAEQDAEAAILKSSSGDGGEPSVNELREFYDGQVAHEAEQARMKQRFMEGQAEAESPR